MKNAIPILLLFLGGANCINAQINILDIEEYFIEAHINLANDELDNMKSSAVVMMSLGDGELTITYPLNRNAPETFYSIKLEIELDEISIPLFEENIIGYFGEKIVVEEDGQQTIQWIGLVESHQQLEGQLRVKLTVEHYRLLNCNNPPVFTSKQKRPFYIAAGVGLLAVGTGQYFKYQSDKIYEEQYLTAQSLEEARPNYDEANKNHHTYLVLTYAGSAILMGDVIWYLLKNGKYKKDLKLFEKSCAGYTLTLRPVMELPAGVSVNASTGLRLTCTF